MCRNKMNSYVLNFLFKCLQQDGLLLFSVTIMGCGGEGLSRDHRYNEGPCPKVHFMAVTSLA